MANIDVNKLKELKNRLSEIENDNVLYIDEDNKTKYVVVSADYFDELESYRAIYDEDTATDFEPNVQIIAPFAGQMSYDDYERIKKQLNDVFDQTFKPKPEKLN